MKVCQSISSISRVAAGVSGFVLPLSQHLAALNMTIEVLSLADEHSGEDLPQWQPLVPTLLKHRLKPFGFSEKYKAALDVMQPAVIHQHGLWMYPSFAVFNWAKNNNIPHIVSPHGMLETWSWNHHHWKKKPIWQLWKKNNLNTAAAIHLTSAQEMHSIRARGITAPVAVIPIGIDITDTSSISKPPASASKKTLLFLSRIHPVKGLENLLHAWQQVKHPDWQLI
jgi:glycosyltransferase involved in cell wall biosynthesis